MSDKTPVENEATGVKTVDVEHFGRTWTVPATAHLSHVRKLRADPTNVGIIDAILSVDDLAAIEVIDPTEGELDKFTDAIAEAMGHKTSGNS